MSIKGSIVQLVYTIVFDFLLILLGDIMFCWDVYVVPVLELEKFLHEVYTTHSE